MNIHEYQAKALLKSYGVCVPEGFLVEDRRDLERQARKIRTDQAVIKAQIHAGGRGKAGGVRLVDNMTDLVAVGEEMLGTHLVTHQTGPEGKIVNKVYIEETSQIEQEYYLSLVVDRAKQGVSVICSTAGGMDIEETAAERPEAIKTLSIDPIVGIRPYQIREMVEFMGFDHRTSGRFERLLLQLYVCFEASDCSMIEINPLIRDDSSRLVILDAKVSFDDNAMFRQEDIFALRDLSEEDDKEVEASSYDLSYVALDGNIGCLVNGAGLAMATMDAIKDAGGQPSNFLDVGGSASVDQVKEACRITLENHSVKGLFVNIFGGIMQCDTVAKGIVEALEEMDRTVPLVVRLEGSNIEAGLEILESSNLDIAYADSMTEGAEKIVKIIEG